jgi:hypothetical protein
VHDPRDLDHRHDNDQRHACLSHRSLSIGAHTTCDRTSSKKDVGSGPDWICHVKWKDNTGTAQNGKFELATKANYCYVAGGPSKIVGTLTISDKHGRQVLNPLFEFDAATTQAPSRHTAANRHRFREPSGGFIPSPGVLAFGGTSYRCPLGVRRA